MGFDLRQVVAGILTLTMFVMLIHMIKRDHFDSVQVRPIFHFYPKFQFFTFFLSFLYESLKGFSYFIFFFFFQTFHFFCYEQSQLILGDLNFYINFIENEMNFNFQRSMKKSFFCLCIFMLVDMLDPQFLDQEILIVCCGC